MTQAFQLSWEPSSGSVQIRLPSGTRLNIGKDKGPFLWAFLDSLQQLHARAPDYLSAPMTEKHFRQVYNKWKMNGNKALEEALASMPEEKRQRLTQTQVEALRDEYFAQGHVAIAPLPKPKAPPPNLKLKDLLDDKALDLDGLC